MNDITRWKAAMMLGIIDNNLDKTISCNEEQISILRQWATIIENSSNAGERDKLLMRKIRKDYK